MPDSHSAPLGAPALTIQGLERFKLKLWQEIAHIDGSSAPATTRELIISKVRAVIAGVDSGIVIMRTGGTPDDWFNTMAPMFKDSVASIQSLLPVVTGACVYNNPPSCINTTSEECAELGGTFYARLSCDSLPSILRS